MIKTVTIDIINSKALKLLQDLELLKLIRVHDEKNNKSESIGVERYKGAMSKQDINDINNQLNELRSEWA